jgi:hypothetical protein
MKNLKTLSINEAQRLNAGYKIYICPWNDYSSRSYWSTYGHAIKCAYKHGLFIVPIAMIKEAIKIQFGF